MKPGFFVPLFLSAALATSGPPQEDAWRMSRERGAAVITMAVTPMRPQVGDLVRCVVTADRVRLDPETAAVALADRSLRLVAHPLTKPPRLVFSFLATAPGRCRIRLEGCGEDFEFRVEPGERPPGGDARAIMQGLNLAWRQGDVQAARDLAPAVKTLLPPRHKEEIEEYRAIADAFRREVDGIRQGDAASLRRIELNSCLRCHIKFRWGIVDDVSRFPELPRE
jgi:hypothetical protein